MAKAGSKTTTTWISLSDAKDLVVSAYGATQKAETLLKKWLGEKRVRWTCELFEPARVADLAALQGVFLAVATVAYSNGDPAFWRADLEINWAESWARERYAHGGNCAYTITVVREEVLAQLPAEPDAPEGTAASWIWLAAEARQMKGKIPPDIRSRPLPTTRTGEADRKAAVADHSIRPQWRALETTSASWTFGPPHQIANSTL